MDPSSVVTIDANGTATVVLPSEVAQEITGYKVEYRILNSAEWKLEEYIYTEQTQIAGPFEEGYTYELRTSFKYGDVYSEPKIFEKFTIPCRGKFG